MYAIKYYLKKYFIYTIKKEDPCYGLLKIVYFFNPLPCWETLDLQHLNYWPQ